jgi:hypothetical protein
MAENFPNSPVALLSETTRDPGLVQLLAPVMTVDEFMAKRTPVQYDFLWDEEDEYQGQLHLNTQEAEIRREQENNYSVVTNQSRAQAAARLQLAGTKDAVIHEIIENYRESSVTPKSDLDLVDSIRADADLRYELGDYLYNEKLYRRLHMMPNRVKANSEKNIKNRGYDGRKRFTSQEYAVLLALSMLDGTFQDPGTDRIELAANGQVKSGQHRAAAEELLS